MDLVPPIVFFLKICDFKNYFFFDIRMDEKNHLKKNSNRGINWPGHYLKVRASPCSYTVGVRTVLHNELASHSKRSGKWIRVEIEYIVWIVDIKLILLLKTLNFFLFQIIKIWLISWNNFFLVKTLCQPWRKRENTKYYFIKGKWAIFHALTLY